MKDRKTFLFLFLVIALSALGACRKQPAPSQNANSSPTPLTQDVPASGAAASGEKFSFRGSIANLKIEVTLLRDGERVTGSYFYPKVGKNIELKGTIDKDGNLDLRESDESGKETGVFKGKWGQATGSPDLGMADISGKWTKPDGSKETTFQLTQMPIEFTAAARVVPKLIKEANKQLHYKIDVEYPQIEGDARFDKFNREARSLIAKNVAAFKTAETSEATPEETDPGNVLADEAQESTLDIGYEIRCATDDLISVEFSEGTYSAGAAHPNSITTVLNYDVKNGKKLALGDLFNPKAGYLGAISGYCIKDLKEQSKKDKDLTLDEIQSGAGPRADNYKAWTITKNGLFIVFDPYQVASYAAGPQHVLVPYSALKDLIKPDGPIGNLAK